MTVELTYETHSTTEDNEAGIATGWLPGRLSAQRRAQAVELGQRRRDGGYAVVFTADQRHLDVVDTTRDLLATLRRERDGERVLAIGHSANRWALEHLLDGMPLATAISLPFVWQPGWTWTLP